MRDFRISRRCLWRMQPSGKFRGLYCPDLSSKWKIETTYFPANHFIIYRTTWRHIPGHSIFQTQSTPFPSCVKYVHSNIKQQYNLTFRAFKVLREILNKVIPTVWDACIQVTAPWFLSPVEISIGLLYTYTVPRSHRPREGCSDSKRSHLIVSWRSCIQLSTQRPRILIAFLGLITPCRRIREQWIIVGHDRFLQNISYSRCSIQSST
jgi:hypothetical protein